jgi:O-antigen ligase
MGPLGFKLKYFGYHPHNIILEFLVEFGMIFGGAAVLLLFYVFSTFLIRIKNLNSSSQIALLFAIAFMPMFLLSGTIWTNPIVLFLAGYSVMFMTDRNIITR